MECCSHRYGKICTRDIILSESLTPSRLCNRKFSFAISFEICITPSRESV